MSLPLRVLHLSDAVFEEKPGGSRQVARELMREQTRAGHDVTILVGRQVPGAATAWRDPECGMVVQYERGANPGAWIRNGREACAKLLQDAAASGKPFDVVHTHFAYAAVGPLDAVAGAVPHVRSFYGPWDAEGFVEDTALATGAAAWKKPLLHVRAHLKRTYRHGVEADNLRGAGRVIILSEQSRGEVADFGYPAQNVVKIPGGVNPSRFFVDTTDAPARQAARARAGLPGDAYPLLLSVRRLVPRMGLENLIAALPAVRAAFPRAHLVIGGRGVLLETLTAQAKSLGVADAVTFAGFIADNTVVDYFRGADLFVLPTLSLEGFGLVTVESLACGTPVIGTPTGATPELLTDLDKRLLTGGTAPADLSAAIVAFCRSQSANGWASELTATKLSAYVAERYTWKRHADAVEAVYRDLIAKRSGG